MWYFKIWVTGWRVFEIRERSAKDIVIFFILIWALPILIKVTLNRCKVCCMNYEEAVEFYDDNRFEALYEKREKKILKQRYGKSLAEK